jgi:4-amino-4-deoxy-L-arabinose transferase-like glycosyltransferase
MSFGWDQSRDAWVVRDILHGQYTLVGPRTGIGQFHLGPLYYYVLVPFFFITKFDPMGSTYLNIILNIVNFVIFYVVTRKMFGSYASLFVIGVYAVSNYIVGINRVPWNVTLMPGISALIFFSIYQIYKGKYMWIYIASLLAGLYFHIHFTAVFLPPIIIASLLFVPKKTVVVKHVIYSLPLFFLWFIPNIIQEITSQHKDYGRYQEFLKYYFIGFHGRFLLHRLNDALVMFRVILYYPPFQLLAYIILPVFIFLSWWKSTKQDKLLAYLLSLWFIIPLFGFTLYGGPLSEYYFLYQVPMVLFIFYIVQKKLLVLAFKPVIVVLIVFWSIYLYQNTKDSWIKPSYGGLQEQKDSVKKVIKNGEKIEFNVGDIKSYLYLIWTEKQ